MTEDNKIKNIYSLSPMQKGMLYHYLMDKNTNEYIEQIELYVRCKDMDKDIFEETVNKVIERHDALRTVFIYENVDQPMQVVLSDKSIKITFDDLSDCSEEEQLKHIRAHSIDEIKQGFDLSKDALMRIILFKVKEGEYKILWTFHHIIMDGWCLQTIFKECIHIYKALRHHTEIRVKTSPEYHEYIKWIQKKPYEDDLNYWKEYLKGYNHTAVVPKNNTIRKQIAQRADHHFIFDEDLTKSLKNLAKQYQVTISNILHGIWGVLLQKYNHTEDVVFGSVTSGRPPDIEGIDETIGLFINTVPCRVNCDSNARFVDVMNKVKNGFSDSNSVSYIGLWDIQKSTPMGTKLIDNILVLENYGFEDTEGSFKTDDLEMLDMTATEVTNYDLDINVYMDHCLRIRASYNTGVYEKSIIVNIERHMRRIVESIVKNPEIQVKNIDIVSEEEKETLIKRFNGNDKDFPADRTIHQLFEEQVKKSPEDIAVAWGNEKRLYRELNKKANQIARLIRREGIAADDTVGILLERSPLMIESILGTWKAGGAYIPIDSTYPVERMVGILEDSNTKLLISETRYISRELESRYKGTIIKLDLVSAALEKENGEDLLLKVEPQHLAYVIYTSGSTGKPKGAMVEHIGMMNHMMAKVSELELTADSIIVQNASQCFDISVWQFFAALICGGKTVIYNNDTIMNPEKFVRKVLEDKATILEVVPSFLDVMMDLLEENRVKFETLRYLVVTGEEVKAKLVQKWFNIFSGIKMVNAYGPTEASDDITHHIMDRWSEVNSIPIGKPIQNFNIYIVDEYMHLCPIGVKGEILVSGIGVGRGYLNDKEKTEQAFMTDPFAKKCNVRLYKTGDLGRWLADGTIAFCGRKDYQVKIRGFRIELGEIESHILQYKGIKNTVVIDRQDENGNKYLCAFITVEKEGAIEGITEHLRNILPEYMIPNYFIQLDAMPLTPNGKIDRKVLNHYEINARDHVRDEEPKTKVEKILADVWGKIFGMENVGLHDNFFAIGGDSIKAMQVTSGLMKQGFKLKVFDLVNYPTIKQCAKYIKSADESIEQKIVQGQVELTAIQKRYFQEIYKENLHYNQSVLLFSTKRIHKQHMERAFNESIIHHDALRMQYENLNNTFLQYNQGIEDLNFRLNVYDLRDSTDDVKDIPALIQKAQESIDIQSELLVKADIYKTRAGDYLFIVIHHLIIDGISWRVLLEDLETIYDQLANHEEVKLPLKTYSFKHWAKHILHYANGEDILQEVPYWRELEKKQIPDLPTDHDIHCRLIKDLESIERALPKEYTQKLLKQTHIPFNTEINDILLTALARTILRWTGNNRTLVHMEGHGRESLDSEIDISRTVGWFTAIYPVILELKDQSNIGRQIKAIKEGLRTIPNKGVGYGLLKYLRSETDSLGLHFSLKPEIIFNYLGQFDNTLTSQDLTVSRLKTYSDKGNDISEPYKLYLNGYVSDGILTLEFKYNKYEFNSETVRHISHSYITLLQEIIDYCCNIKETRFTPSDFSHKELSQEDVDGIMDFVDELEFIE